MTKRVYAEQMEVFARSGSLYGISDLLQEHGQSPDTLLRDVGLDASVLHDPDQYVPYLTLVELFLLSAARCRLEDFGLRLGASQGVEVMGALGSILCVQATVGDALQLARKNLGFHAYGIQLEFQPGKREVGISIDYVFSRQVDCRQNFALVAALIQRCASQLHGSPIRPTRVEFSFPESSRTPFYDEFFGCPITFERPASLLSYPVELLRAPLNVQPDERERLSELWQRGWGEGGSPDLRARVESAISALLPTGACSVTSVASVVGMHPRNLQMDLKADGTAYAVLLEAVRRKLAYHHLRRRDVDLTTLALDLGYSELSPFSRAFKSWTGQSPALWRKTLLDEPPS